MISQNDCPFITRSSLAPITFWLHCHVHIYLFPLFFVPHPLSLYTLTLTSLFSHPPLSPPLSHLHYSLPLYSVSIMRSAADVYQHHSLLLQAPNLNAVFDSLNVLGTCPWKINTKVCIHSIIYTNHWHEMGLLEFDQCTCDGNVSVCIVYVLLYLRYWIWWLRYSIMEVVRS